MMRRTETGFTVIETMLFLAISGLLTAAILSTAGIAIAQQRYRDSVDSYAAYLKEQYNNVTNVTNQERSTKYSCHQGSKAPVADGSGELRGRTDCVIVGELVTLSDDTVTTRQVGASAKSASAEKMSDYNLFLLPAALSQDSYKPKWDTSIVTTDGASMAHSFLIVRPPESSSIQTYSATRVIESTPASLAALVEEGPVAVNQSMCLKSADVFSGPRLGVMITAGASSSDGVVPLEDGVC